MTVLSEVNRFVREPVPQWLRRPVAQLQPMLAKEGKTNIDLEALREGIAGLGELAPSIAVQSPGHWEQSVRGLGPEVDAILPVSITAYPTEVWNSHPGPLIERRLPFVFWPIIAYDEPDFWRWSARDFLTTLGVEVHLVKDVAAGNALLRSLALRRFLQGTSMVVFGEQNFPWNAPAIGHKLTEQFGTRVVVRPINDIHARYAGISDTQVDTVWARRKTRYIDKGVAPAELRQAVRTYIAIRAILEEERALGFGVNCFGDLVIKGGRDVPCLAQTLLREDGYIASCDGDFLAMMSMVLTSFFLDKPCMMSNMYPLRYKGALTDHFGDPLSPSLKKYPRSTWPTLCRLGHCGFTGVVSPEMDPHGKVALHDWGGTYEIQRDGRGCGIDGGLRGGEAVTMVQLKFDGKTLLVTEGKVCETTRHRGMPHCESTILLRFEKLEQFVENISREHSVFVYGRHAADYEVLGRVLGLNCQIL